jgi:hypothetical protein
MNINLLFNVIVICVSDGPSSGAFGERTLQLSVSLIIPLHPPETVKKLPEIERAGRDIEKFYSGTFSRGLLTLKNLNYFHQLQSLVTFTFQTPAIVKL